MTLSTCYVTSESVLSGAAIKKDARPVIRTGILCWPPMPWPQQAFEWCYWACCSPAMLTSHAMPNLSTHIPKVSPHGALSSGMVTVPPSTSLSQ